LAKLNDDALNPMPSASVRTATRVKPGAAPPGFGSDGSAKVAKELWTALEAPLGPGERESG
jgi:hypothetical protein